MIIRKEKRILVSYMYFINSRSIKSGLTINDPEIKPLVDAWNKYSTYESSNSLVDKFIVGDSL